MQIGIIALPIKLLCLKSLLLLLSWQIQAKQPITPTASSTFELVVLGDSGGIQDGNLSAYLLRALSDPNYIALDAGTLVNGINVSLSKNAFKDLAVKIDNSLSPTGNILQHHIQTRTTHFYVDAKQR